MDPQEVVFFFRKPKPHYHSIERVFTLIIDNLPASVLTRKYYLKGGDHGIISRLKALLNVRKAKGEVNHITGDISYVAMALPKKGLIVTFHDLESLERGNKLKTKLLKWVWVVLPARRAEKITVISDHTKQKVKEWASVDDNKITVIPNPLPQGFIFSPKLYNSECPTILAMGTKPNKNLEGTIEAIKEMSCRLIVAGHLYTHQLQMLEKYGIEYENLVGASDQQIIDAYKRCDLLCFPSFYEGFGIPIIEAQAIGRPVITSRIGAMPGTAGKDGALLVNPHDPCQIADAILTLSKNEILREGLILNGRRNAERYSLNLIVERYSDLYNSNYYMSKEGVWVNP